jgi:hypothetical protein
VTRPHPSSFENARVPVGCTIATIITERIAPIPIGIAIPAITAVVAQAVAETETGQQPRRTVVATVPSIAMAAIVTMSEAPAVVAVAETATTMQAAADTSVAAEAAPMEAATKTSVSPEASSMLGESAISGERQPRGKCRRKQNGLSHCSTPLLKVNLLRSTPSRSC